MKKTSKILLVLFLISVVGCIICLSAVVNFLSNTQNPTLIAFVGMFFILASLAFGIVLYVKFLFRQSFGLTLFFMWLPITAVFAFFVYTTLPNSTVQLQFVRLATQNYTTNMWYFFGVVLLYVLVMFVVFMLASIPISRLQKATSRLGDGPVNGHIKLGRNKQLKDIEFSLAKINQNYIEQHQKLQQTKSEVEKFIPKQLLAYMGAKNVADLQLGQQVQKVATTMFCRVQSNQPNSTLQEQFERLNAYLHVISPVISRFGGVAVKYLGEGISAVFAKPDHALDCSKAIFASVSHMRSKQMQISIAVHTDQVVFGITGEHKQKGLTVLGNQTDIEQKLQQVNNFFGTFALFTAQTLEQLPFGYALSYRYVGTIKDQPTPVAVFENLDVYLRIRREKLLSTKNSFEQAVRLFEGGDYTGAKNIFANILKNIKQDRVSYVYYNLCDQKLKQEI